MRYLVIHSLSYGGEGPWKVSFEIEAEHPGDVSWKAYPRRGGVKGLAEDAEKLRDEEPGLTAGDAAIRTGGQFIGMLAEKESGKVVFDSGAMIEEPHRFHWRGLNAPPLS